MSDYKILAEAIALGKFKHLEVTTEDADYPRLGVDDIKRIMKEEFKAAKETHRVKAKQSKDKAKSWEAAGVENMENEIDWMRALKISEHFGVK